MQRIFNGSKLEAFWRVKYEKSIFIWQTSPVFTGNARDVGAARVKAAHFCKKLQKAVESENLDWQVELDDTYADIYELIEKDFELLILAPGGKTRFYIPKKLKEKIKDIPRIDLDMLEYYNSDIRKTFDIMSKM